VAINWEDNGLFKDFRYNRVGFKYEGKLPFKTWMSNKEYDGYDTFFGPFAACPWSTYKKSPANLQSAFLRLSSARENEEFLQRQQSKNLRVRGRRFNRFLRSRLGRVKELITWYFGQLGDNWVETIKSAVARHPKRELRKRAILNLVGMGASLDTIFMERVQGKVKVPEFAKPGKKPRLIGDFSTEGSLVCGFLVPIVKAAFIEDALSSQDADYMFIGSAKPAEIDHGFQVLLESEKKLRHIFHSDDSSISIGLNGVDYPFNVDISSCDAGNGKPVFDVLEWLCSGSAYFVTNFQKAIKQCTRKLVLRNPFMPGEVVTCKPTRPTEFSGTQLTSILNNIASFSIGLRIEYEMRRKQNLHASQLRDMIIRCANAVGHNVTVEPCDRIEKIQFLKYSPTVIDGRVTSFMNVGVLLRAIGHTDGDLPGRTGPKKTGVWERARAFVGSVTNGFKNGGENTIFRTLADKYPLPKGKWSKHFEAKVLARKPYLENAPGRGVIPDSAILNRYGLESADIMRICDMIRASDVGYSFHDPAVRKIMSVDYSAAQTSPLSLKDFPWLRLT
jgi:hypothetical protein